MTQEQLTSWNDFFPPHSPCVVRLDNGSEFETRTLSEAWLLGDGTPVVRVSGIAGGIDLDRVRMSETHKL